MAASGVSVIVPAFNAEATIAETIRTVLAQRLPPDEIVVVDDGSTDRTPDILHALAAAEPRLRVLRQDNAGPMAARNRAIAGVRGRYVAPLDADDLWHPDYLADMIAALDRSQPPAGFAYALYRLIDEDGLILRDGTDFGVTGHALHRHLLVNFVGSGSNAVFRRTALVAAGRYDVRTREWGGGEDYLLQMRVAATWPVARVGRRLVGYRRHAGSLSSDPRSAHRAQIRAVGQMLSEVALHPRPIRRWTSADAARTLAAALLQHGERLTALRWGLSALAADPVATLAEFTRRLANAAHRRRGKQLEAVARRFVDADPDRHFGGRPDMVMRRRLDRLARLDRVPAQLRS